METTTSSVTSQDYDMALLSQSACNLSGIVFSFARIMERICDDGGGTQARNTHAICRLFAEQIMFLSDNGDNSYCDAYDTCQKLSKGGAV